MTKVHAICSYRAGDETAFVALWNATMWADPIDAAEWRSRFLLDPNFRPDLCLIATDGDVLTGFMLGMVQRESKGYDGWIVGFGVAESRRRRGVASALLARLQTAMSQMGISRISIGPYIPGYLTPGIDENTYPEAIAFIRETGATLLDRPLSMSVSLTGYRPESMAVARAKSLQTEGVNVRPAVPSDILPLLTFLEAHFPHWKGDAAGVMRELFGSDPRHVTLHIAEDNGTIIGYAQSRGERFGPFGVDEAYRGRGVGAAMLATVLPAMRARGFHCAWFLWTNDRAAKLYAAHGFSEVRRFALFALNVSPVAT